jgi:hypothetical protein
MYSFAMRVRVRLRREGSEWRQPYGLGRTASGDLHLTLRTVDTRRVQKLELIGADRIWPALFDPRLTALSANAFAFIAFERHGNAWVMQQWDCELL